MLAAISGMARAGESQADLACSTAQDVEAGPVAMVHLGHRVPDGFTAIGRRGVSQPRIPGRVVSRPRNLEVTNLEIPGRC